MDAVTFFALVGVLCSSTAANSCQPVTTQHLWESEEACQAAGARLAAQARADGKRAILGCTDVNPPEKDEGTDS